jgi:phosphatidylinositol glycan class V
MEPFRLFKHFILAKLVIYAAGLLSSFLIIHGEQGANHYRDLFPSTGPLLFTLMRPFIFYDGDFFLEIALHGYRYDKAMAFFPGFPLVSKGVAAVLGTVTGTNQFVSLVVGGLLVNWTCHFASILMLGMVLDSFPETTPRFKRTCQLLMIFNPMGLYFASFYSESLFLAVQTGTFLFIAHSIKKNSFGFGNALVASFLFGLAGFIRSNGFLSVGFVIYFYVTQNLKKDGILRAILLTGLAVGACFIPFVAVQASESNLICANEAAPFCSKKFSPVYGFLQAKYWDVAFLTFVEGRRPANLAYALPILLSLYFLLRRSFQRHFAPKRILNFVYGIPVRSLDDFLFPSAVLLCLLLAVGVTTMHFNSFNRLLAGYPFYYVFFAHLYEGLEPRGKKALLFWAGPFQLLVTVLAVNNYIPL